MSLNPGPISMSSSRSNHCGRLSNGNWARSTVEGPKWACDRGGFDVGELLGPKLVWVAKREWGSPFYDACG